MKKLFLGSALVLILLSLEACSKEDTLKVNLFEEFQNRPTVTLSLTNGTIIPGFEGNYCTDVVCMNSFEPDFSQLTYTSVPGEDTLFIKVETTYEISSISGSFYKKDGSEFYRDLSFIETEPYIYIPDPPREIEEIEVTLHVKVDFEDQGLTHYYFPIKFE